MRKAYVENTCDYIEQKVDKDIFYYNSGAFDCIPAEIVVVHWPIESQLREKIAKYMFETFYPLYIICKTSKDKVSSYEVSYIIESTSNSITKYTICLEKNYQETITCTIDLTNKTNEILLLEFENWFEDEGLHDIYQKLNKSR